MDININGSANLKGMTSQFARLELQVAELNEELAKTALAANNGMAAQAKGWKTSQRALSAQSAAWRDAANSTGNFAAQQVRVSSATETFAKNINKQKISFSDLLKNQKLVVNSYKEQLRLQNAVVRSSDSMKRAGKGLYDIGVPYQVSDELDTINKRLQYSRSLINSASTQMVNWGKNTQWAGRQLMVGFTVPTAIFGAATAKLAYDVDTQMTRIKKVYDTTTQAIAGDTESVAAANKELAEVSAAAWKTATDASKEYGASATDTLKVQADLAAIGLTGSALQGATQQTVRIGTLGELDFTQATDMTIALQTAFKNTIKTSDDLANAFNFMNATENATSLTIQDIAEATPRAASAMAALGVNVEQMTVLLTSMKESGVDAAEAANALKSATGTILAPSPAAAKFIDQISDGKVQVNELAAASNGNLYDALEMLYQQMEGLSELQKQQIIVKLFGKYQFNRVSAMLTNLGGAFEGTQNQTAKAMDLMGKSSGDLANIAELEMTRFQESISGRFKIALQTVKNELAEMGEPFLELGIVALDVAGKFAAFFNSFPGWTKKVFVAGAVLAGLAGALTMLVGLTANFMGTGIKAFVGVASKVMGLGAAEELLTVETVAAQKAQEMMTDSLNKQQSAITSLTEQLRLLIAVEAEAKAAAMGILNPGIVGAAASVSPYSAPMTGPGAIPPAFNPFGITDEPKAAVSDELAAMSDEQDDLADGAEREAKSRKAAATAAAAGTIAMGAMGVEMANNATIQSDTLSTLSTMVMTAGFAIPVFQLMSGAVGKVVGQIKAMRTAQLAAREASVATSGASLAGAAATTKWAKAGNFLKLGVAGLASPMGIAVAGAAAAAAGTYLWYQHVKKVREEQEAQNKAVYDNNNLLEKTLDIQTRQRATLNTVNTASPDTTGASVFDMADDISDSKSGKALADSIKNAESTEERNAIVGKKYIDILESVGGSAEKAEKYVTALFMASGKGALYAQERAAGFREELGSSVSIAEKSNLFGGLFDNMIGDSEDSIKTQGKALGLMLADSLATGTNDNFDSLATTFEANINQVWTETYSNLDKLTKAQVNKFGITSGAALKNMLAEYKQYRDGIISQDEFQNLYPKINIVTDSRSLRALEILNESGDSGDAAKGEAAVVKELATQLGIEKDIYTIQQLKATWEYKLQTATKANGQQLYNDRIAALKAEKAGNAALADAASTYGGVKNDYEAVSYQQELQTLNQIRLSMGLKEAKYLVEGFTDGFSDAADAAGRVADKVNNLPWSKTVQINFVEGDYKKMLQTSMGAVQSSMGDQIQQNFDDKMQASIDAVKAAGDARVDAAEKAQDKALDAFDKRWDKRKKKVEDFYDKQKDGIDKAIKAEEKAEDIRQKIFEAEQARLDRAAEMANRNIDFNVALNSGNFDEAAKIRNDASAQYASWAAEDANGKASDKSAAKVDSLNAQQDALDKAKEKRLDAMDEESDKLRDALVERQKNHIDYLKKQADLDEKAAQNKWNKDKAMLKQTLDLFKSWQGTSVKDLEGWMKEVGLSYDDFGDSDLKPKGQKWAQYFRQQLKTEIRKAGTDIASDHMWADMGDEQAQAILKSFGFDSMRSLKHFVKTGEIKKFDTGPKPVVPADANGGDGGFINGSGKVIRHAGGTVNSDPGSRTGVARTQKGLHSSERWIVAQDGEEVVNRRASAKHRDFIQHINNGGSPTDFVEKVRGKPVMGGAGLGPAGLVSGIIGSMMMQGMGNALSKGIDAAKGRYAPSGVGNIGSIMAGMYGGVNFDAEQLKYAAVIANVGKSMGITERGIQIALMTAMAESGLRNLNYGDRDSVGLFQQRTSQGWGSVEQILDPSYAATQFFTHLKGVEGYDSMTPWLAAQAVQRSAYTDGSNYKNWWAEAQAIFASMNSAGQNGTFTSTPGTGGRHRPIMVGTPGGVHDTSTGYPAIDIAAPIGSAIYAVGNGSIVKSEDIRGYEPRRMVRGQTGDAVQDGYRSYGRMMVLALDTGGSVLYAHLSQRAPTGRVEGGAQIGKSGNTGYVISSASDGAHLHFGASNGAPLSYMKKGGFTNKNSEGLAYLHEREMVATKPMTKDIITGVNAMKNQAVLTPDITNALNDIVATMASPNFGAQVGMSYSLGNGTSLRSTGADATSGGGLNTAATGNLRLGTYNVLFSSKNEGTKTDLSKLFTKADVLALTEFVGDKRNLEPWINQQGWGVSGKSGDSAVLWNKAMYKLTDEGSKQLSTQNRTGTVGGKPRIANWAKLTDANGGSFYQIAAHTVPQDAGSASTRAEQFKNLKDLVATLSKSGNPVFLAGDLNTDSSQKKYMGGAQDFGFGLNTKKSTKGTIGKYGTVFDWIFSTPGVEFLNSQLMKGTSDHRALLQQFNIPSFKTGGDIRVGGLANLHAEERVLDAVNTRRLDDGLANFANGGGNTYNVNVNANGTNLDERKLARHIISEIDAKEARKPQNRRGRGN